MLEYYANRADRSEAVYDRPERQEDLRFLRAWVPSVFCGRNVLEVACGTGYWTRRIASTAKSVVAVDAVPEVLEIARWRNTHDHVSYVVADAFALPDHLGKFDAVFAGLWISHVPKGRIRTFLEGLHRHLISGAAVLFIDNSRRQCEDFPIAGQDDDGNTYQLRKLGNGIHRILKNFPSQLELESTIHSVGVRPVYRTFENFWAFQFEAL